MTERADFFKTIRNALGRPFDDELLHVAEATALFKDKPSVQVHAEIANKTSSGSAMSAELVKSAAAAGWKVTTAESGEIAARQVADIIRDAGAQFVMRSTHSVLTEINLSQVVSDVGVEMDIAIANNSTKDTNAEKERQRLRNRLLKADVGITGVDYAIAETGSCVIVGGRGVSRLVSLLPPIHVAVVKSTQILPSLDELFALRRASHQANNTLRYMNIISGPSRSADIEQTLIQGMHGPKETHIVLLE